jgi:uncharacterized protein
MMNNPPKFVIDTNVIVSASLFSQSVPRQAFDKAQDIGIILLSQSVFAEIEEVLFRSKLDRYVSREIRAYFLENLLKTAALIEVYEKIDECRDPKDNKFLELAVSGQADCLISGDRDLLILNPFRGIDVLTVQEFLAQTRD